MTILRSGYNFGHKGQIQDREGVRRTGFPISISLTGLRNGATGALSVNLDMCGLTIQVKDMLKI